MDIYTQILIAIIMM